MAGKDMSGWRNLYLAAVLESDRTMLPGRIAEARNAIVEQARKLFHNVADSRDERQALDRALYSLNALTSCLQLGSRQ